MNHRTIFWAFFTLIILNLISKNYEKNNSTYAQTTNREVAGTLIEVEGSVMIKSPSHSQYTSAENGTKIYYNDLLLTSSETRAIVLCSNSNKKWFVPAGVVSGVANGCPRINSNVNSPR